MHPDEPKKLTRRVRRAAQTLRYGSAILDFLQRPAMRTLLVEGAKEGVPPVSKVSTELLTKFGDDMKQMPVRQFCGMAVKAVLAEEGWELEDTGIRIHDDPVFRSGATYSKAEAEESVDEGKILRSMILGLSEAQLHRLRNIVEENIL